MNREDVGMDLTFENMDILRKEVQATKLLLSECDKVLEEDGGVYIELRAFLSGKMSADDVIALLASQQGEQVKHPEQAEGAQGERERFEVEMLELCLPIERDSHGAYVSDHVRHLWSGWELRAALAQPSPAEDMSAAQELAGVKAILNDMADALKRLTFHARTTGGTAGPDAALMNACERAERILSLGGMGAAFMRGCDEHESQPSPAPELPSLTPGEMENLHDFYGSLCDGVGHRVEKEGMRRLAELGAVESVGFGKHRLTKFGEYLLGIKHATVAQDGQVPEGWRVMRCTSSIQREGDKWEIYDPHGSGGVVSTHDVKDWAVRGLLDALAAAPAQGE